jgi:hypothetical protein
MKCKHPTLTIVEEIKCFGQHTRDNGEWSHNNVDGSYNSKLDVSCRDCGMHRMFWRGSKNLPKYLKEAMRELGWT